MRGVAAGAATAPAPFSGELLRREEGALDVHVGVHETGIRMPVASISSRASAGVPGGSTALIALPRISTSARGTPRR
ncbi:hypothetical protein [Streptomyces sp. NBC_00120]|uniref:Uncharacterized protein n=1 Tax=Streptomyces sp. NBC_00119 TaxID=2975659 RepID=A0AAU1U143_9ACTN|nr:hypothetical protein [Streptomyces sp. NBC_00120]MCX5323095.1 hypothetical protein [Streptomyces sp. NBC_00120]